MKNKAKRIGKQMASAVDFVRSHPGCAILPVAEALHRAARAGNNMALGYDPVHRAIAAGLILATRLPSGRYVLKAAS